MARTEVVQKLADLNVVRKHNLAERQRYGSDHKQNEKNRKGDGGPKEDRTPDLCIANAALSQLSYRP